MLTTSLLLLLLTGVSAGVLSLSLCVVPLAAALLLLAVGGYANLLSEVMVTPLGMASPISVLMFMLSIWVSLLMLVVSVKYSYDSLFPSLFAAAVCLLLILVSLFFYVKNFLAFYVLFESSLFPTVYLILKWGYQPERLRASFYFMMYTICGSLPLLFVVCYMYATSHSFSLAFFYPFSTISSPSLSYLFVFALLFAFMVKMPMWGVHLWLPKAHVEAPVSGSMVLAGVLLKLGGYGLVMVLPLFTMAPSSVLDAFLGINLWGALIVSVVCLCNVDMKSLIAYSSVIHMGMVVVGVLSGSSVGMVGAVLMMVGHGFSSPGMFSLANFNYEATGTRNLALQKGLSSIHPNITLFWFVIICANMAAPPSLNLAAELFICVSLVKVGSLMAMFVLSLTFLSAAYNLYLFSCQQGGPTSFVGFGPPAESNFLLSSFLHATPVYLSTLSIYLL